MTTTTSAVRHERGRLPTDRPTLLVATTGGHLEQLRRLAPTLGLGAREWVTHETDQAANGLAGETVHYVPYVGPRDFVAAATVVPHAIRLLRSRRFGAVVTTGAAVAMPFVMVARSLGIPCHYIESATRTDGPSLTGSMVRRVPGVRLYTQHPGWADDRWRYGGSIFEGFQVEPIVPDCPIRQVVVTLGTMRTYGFRRAVDRLVEVLPQVAAPGAEVLWQTGATPIDGVTMAGAAVNGRVSVPAAELHAAIARADLVIAHAGIGSALAALQAGRSPVLLPRQSALGEHVDDHQQGIAKHLRDRGLAVSVDPDALTAGDLHEARTRRVSGETGRTDFVLSR